MTDAMMAAAGHPGLAGGPIYLDYNATTPVDPQVVDAAVPYLATHFGNPSSAHGYAAQPRRAVAGAREAVAALIGAAPGEIVFTAGGSEADTLAIRGAVLARGAPAGAQVITQPTEHPAVLEACAALARLHGTQVTYLPVGGDGRVDPASLAAAITSRTVLVSVMAANSETGVLQPVRELAAVAREHGVLFHTDAAQAAGKMGIDVHGLGVDLLTIVGHKMYAPKGIGALYVRAGVPLEPLVYGGGQERGLRAGTENVALAVALGQAARLAAAELAAGGPQRLRELRDLLHRRLDEQLPGLVNLNGHPQLRLPGTLNVSITGVPGGQLLAAAPGVAAATGSACHAGSTEPSPVLLAMGHGEDRASSALRLTVGRWTTRKQVQAAATQIAAAARSLLAGKDQNSPQPATPWPADLPAPGKRLTAVTQNADPRAWLFSYGTLQNPQVQIATFGRRLAGHPDALPGYALSAIEITDPGVIAASGRARHPIITATGDDNDRVDGAVYDVTPAELEAADRYEAGQYRRVWVRLASGTDAWAYINGQA